MKWQNTVFAFLAAAALGSMAVLAYLYTGALLWHWNRPRPVIPAGYEMILEKVWGCDQPFYPEAYGRGYVSKPENKFVALVTYGRLQFSQFEIKYEDPTIWVFYPDDGKLHPFDESTYRIVTLPYQAPRYLSVEELKAEYPKGPCSIPPAQEVTPAAYDPQGGLFDPETGERLPQAPQ